MPFNKVVNRRGTDCAKWDSHTTKGVPGDALPMWVADMDFETVPQVIEAINQRAKHGVYGYTTTSSSYCDSIVGWMKRRHDWEVQSDWILTIPGVVPAINLAIHAFTGVGDAVLIQNPVYPPFSGSVLCNQRKLVNSPLLLKDGKYQVDFADFEAKIIDNNVRLFILCSPHNPVGRVWTKEELEEMGDICLKHGVIIVSDEIHQDFVFPGHRHYPLPTVKPAYRDISIVCTAPSKTFNLAGLQASNIIIPNKRLRDKFTQAADGIGLGMINTFGLVACEAAYTHGDKWLDDAIDYVAANAVYVKDYIANRLPMLKLVDPQGLYLLWIDFSGLGMTPEELEEFMHTKARIWSNQGYTFGPEGQGFQRINLACPRSTLEEAMERLEKAINQ